MSLYLQIACILQSKHHQILKMPRHEQETLHRTSVNIETVCSANITRYILTIEFT